MPPNHALQRTRRERRGCNPCVPCAGSLSLGRSADKGAHVTRWFSQSVVHLFLFLVATTVAGAMVPVPFEDAAATAPIVVIARAERGDGDSWSLSITRVVRGSAAVGMTAHALTHHMSPRLEEGRLYLVLLDRDMWPYPLTSDSDCLLYTS